MKTLAALILSLTALSAFAAPFPKGDAQAGKALFDKNDCNSCHRDMLGGDGSAIFTRPNHKVKNPTQLVDQMHRCSGNVGITLTQQDEQNLGAYLSQTYYKFK